MNIPIIALRILYSGALHNLKITERYLVLTNIHSHTEQWVLDSFFICPVTAYTTQYNVRDLDDTEIYKCSEYPPMGPSA